MSEEGNGSGKIILEPLGCILWLVVATLLFRGGEIVNALITFLER